MPVGKILWAELFFIVVKIFLYFFIID